MKIEGKERLSIVDRTKLFMEDGFGYMPKKVLDHYCLSYLVFELLTLFYK